MTSVIAFVRPDCAVLAADRATWGPDGRIYDFRQKLIHAPGAQSVVVAQGTFNADLFGHVVRPARSLRRLHTLICRFMERNVREIAALEAWTGYTGAMCVTGASWFEGAPTIWGICQQYQNPGDRLEPKQLGSFFLAPMVDWSQAVGRSIETREEVGTMTAPDVVNIMESQRRLLDQPDGMDGPVHLAGGGCDVATIDAAGVRIETIKEWPDQVGERIAA